MAAYGTDHPLRLRRRFGDVTDSSVSGTGETAVFDWHQSRVLSNPIAVPYDPDDWISNHPVFRLYGGKFVKTQVQEWHYGTLSTLRRSLVARDGRCL